MYFKVQNEQCQEMIQTDDQKWIKVTNNGGWDTHTVRVYSYSRLIQLRLARLRIQITTIYFIFK